LCSILPETRTLSSATDAGEIGAVDVSRATSGCLQTSAATSKVALWRVTSIGELIVVPPQRVSFEVRLIGDETKRNEMKTLENCGFRNFDFPRCGGLSLFLTAGGRLNLGLVQLRERVTHVTSSHLSRFSAFPINRTRPSPTSILGPGNYSYIYILKGKISKTLPKFASDTGNS